MAVVGNKKKFSILQRYQANTAAGLNVAKSLMSSSKKPIGQPQSDVDFRPQPESRKPTVFPEYNPRFTVNPDKSVRFEHGERMEEFNPAEYEGYKRQEKGESLKDLNLDSGSIQRIISLRDYEAVQKALAEESKSAIPKGISNQAQLDIYNRIKGGEQASKEEEIRAIAAKESAKPVEPLQKAGSPELAAGFVASGLVGGSGVAGLAATGVLGGAAATAIATPAVLVVGTALLSAKALMAAQGKNREQDIKSAKSTSSNAMKYLNLYKAEALNPQADQEDLISDYYEMKRQVYAAQAMLSDRSLFDRSFRVNEGADELAKIEIWMANEDNLDRDFFNNLANSDGALYEQRIGNAVKSLNQESQQ